ncbi:hypothetical protein GCM10027060_20980 [Nesterenkonia halophila]
MYQRKHPAISPKGIRCVPQSRPRYFLQSYNTPKGHIQCNFFPQTKLSLAGIDRKCIQAKA